MTNISTLRQTLRDWFSSLVRIDSFSLDIPRDLSSPNSTALLPLPGNTLREYPAEKVHYKKSGVNSIEGSATFQYSLIYRYPGYLEYKNLPIQQLESLSEYIQGSALLSDLGCNVRAIVSNPVDASVNPQRLPGLVRQPLDPTRESLTSEELDWIVYINFSFGITFSFTAFLLPPEFGINPVILPSNYPKDLKIYLSQIPLQKVDVRLDTEKIIPLPK